jgi:hypothetical protein
MLFGQKRFLRRSAMLFGQKRYRRRSAMLFGQKRYLRQRHRLETTHWQVLSQRFPRRL